MIFSPKILRIILHFFEFYVCKFWSYSAQKSVYLQFFLIKTFYGIFLTFKFVNLGWFCAKICKCCISFHFKSVNFSFLWVNICIFANSFHFRSSNIWFLSNICKFESSSSSNLLILHSFCFKSVIFWLFWFKLVNFALFLLEICKFWCYCFKSVNINFFSSIYVKFAFLLIQMCKCVNFVFPFVLNEFLAFMAPSSLS